MVMVTEGDSVREVAAEAERTTALGLATVLRARGGRVWVMRVDGPRAECASHAPGWELLRGPRPFTPLL